MRVRCPKCSHVNDHPDELGWRKTECPVCFHPFVATRALAVVEDEPDESDEPDEPGGHGERARPGPVAALPALRAAGPGVPRSAVIAVAGALLLAAGFFARTWLVARCELHELQQKLDELAAEEATPGGGSTGGAALAGAEAAHADATDGITRKLDRLREKIAADHVLIALQSGVIEELQSRVKTLETKVERGENALAREKEAHGDTKGKVDAFLKENMALRREIDALVREIRSLETGIERGR